MKLILVLAALAAVAWAKPASDATVLKYENENIGVDGYHFAFDTSDGISRSEDGTLQNAGSENEAISAQGSASWKDEITGKTITLTFVADENGYRPKFTIS